MKTHAAGASEPHVAAAARDALGRGNALDAVLVGVLVAAAESPTVLLGPLQILVGGTGVGLRAVDGRVRQPGLGVPRPRGVLAGELVPPAGRVAVPTLPAALAVALASLGASSQLRIVGPAIEHARLRSPERAEVLEAFGHRGAAAFTDPAVASELLAVAGRSASGLLTLEDLQSARPTIASCDDGAVGPSGFWKVPWAPEGPPQDASSTHVVAAVDAHGMVAIACYEAPIEGLEIAPLGLVAPPLASPVLRGQRRVTPGQVCGAAAPIALRVSQGVADCAVGLAQSLDAEAALEGLLAVVSGTLVTADAISAASSGRPVVIIRARGAASVLASAS